MASNNAEHTSGLGASFLQFNSTDSLCGDFDKPPPEIRSRVWTAHFNNIIPTEKYLITDQGAQPPPFFRRIQESSTPAAQQTNTSILRTNLTLYREIRPMLISHVFKSNLAMFFSAEPSATSTEATSVSFTKYINRLYIRFAVPGSVLLDRPRVEDLVPNVEDMTVHIPTVPDETFFNDLVPFFDQPIPVSNVLGKFSNLSNITFQVTVPRPSPRYMEFWTAEELRAKLRRREVILDLTHKVFIDSRSTITVTWHMYFKEEDMISFETLDDLMKAMRYKEG